MLKYKHTGADISGLSAMIFTSATKITALLNFVFPFIKNKMLLPYIDAFLSSLFLL